jgi:hypothetical protein
MTGEEMEKVITFILDQQAKFDVRQEQLQEEAARLRLEAEQDRKFVREVLHEMARGIAELSVNADADRQEIIKLGVSAETDRQEFQNTIRQMKEQAEEDRRSTREMITIAVEQANADRAVIVEQANADRAVIQAVVKEVHIINERFIKLESQRNRPQ